MTVNSYLTNLANASIIRDQEKAGIQRSINTISERLRRHFGGDINRSVIFGSYSRGTILPRHMDQRSDIDYMVVFAESNHQPQTYLNRLRRFVETYYARSEIAQSNPTIVLSLNHIRFELVPAIDDWFNGLRIPAKASSFSNWIDTDPTGFNQELINKNQSHYNLIKPLVRIMKYWNSQNRYPYDSYELEQLIVGHGYWFSILSASTQIRDYFFDVVESLQAGLLATKLRQDAVARARRLVDEAKSLERQGYTDSAERVIRRLLPPPGVFA
ncbi:MAG: nucleotidyltransferase domain-containing protein [Candidatus Thiodiazotropha sp.]